MKKILTLVLTVLMVMSMAACAPADDADNPGGTLTVDIEENKGQITAVFLEGPTEIVEIMDIG